MHVQTTADEELGLLMVTVTGVTDASSASALGRVFDVAAAAGHRRILVDLTGPDEVHPAVAATFLELDERLTAAGGWLWLVHGGAELAAALRSTGVVSRVRTSQLVRTGNGGHH